jgi:hypothetical protein
MGFAYFLKILDDLARIPDGPISLCEARDGLRAGDSVSPTHEQYVRLIDLANELGLVLDTTFRTKDYKEYPHLQVYQGYVVGSRLLLSALPAPTWMGVDEFERRMRATAGALRVQGVQLRPHPQVEVVVWGGMSKWESAGTIHSHSQDARSVGSLIADIPNMLVKAPPQPYQLRAVVVDEKAALDIKRDSLRAFINRDEFDDVPPDERRRMVRQLGIMDSYSAVLGERIAGFS